MTVKAQLAPHSAANVASNQSKTQMPDTSAADVEKLEQVGEAGVVVVLSHVSDPQARSPHLSFLLDFCDR